ncbi:hypothetical protein [Legionella longbeachae]|uniref:Uncharacterized protein n=1 Tax=Legionella longbeachae serogroup 1 (strain NSW150) TaxID=661367 RepID=D3HQP8_LEGLN|nr:hypothetical protein [Legionella longbeachae]HBD7396490.1 M protein [Legionella pneumophila]EEZ95666.1 putative M protein [Legionella longbeachae D-4968]QEY50829.1 M protein [Legionella longbeachae]QIN31659.1 M protein [Legionella longbeachae]QIN35002.1 M protein [Legionella longbeachae]
MTQLEDLIYSLATVIVRYHDSQAYTTRLVSDPDKTKLKRLSRLCAIDIIKNPEEKFDEKLTSVIKACTPGYPDREKYLTFLLNEISFLKPNLSQKTPYTSEELEEIQRQITQFFIDCRQLLKKLKTQNYEITCTSIKPVEIKGLINTAYTGGYFCTSGDLLIDETLNRFNISKDSSDEEIIEAASSICREYQNILLISELKSQKLELKSQKSTLELKVSELEDVNSKLVLQNSGLDAQKKTLELEASELEHEKSTLTQQKLELEEQKFSLERQKSTLESDKSALTLQTFKLTEKNQGQEIAIEGLRRDLEKAKEELRRNMEKHQKDVQKHQIEFERFKKQKIEMHQVQEKTIEELRRDLENTQAELEKTQLEFQRFKKQKIETHQAHEKTIEELHRELENVRAELEKTQLEFENFKKQKAEELPFPKRQLPSLYSGLAPFYLLNQQMGKGTFFQSNLSSEKDISIVEDVTSKPNID